MADTINHKYLVGLDDGVQFSAVRGFPGMPVVYEGYDDGREAGTAKHNAE